MLNLKKPQPAEKPAVEATPATANKTQMNILVSPAFKLAVRKHALDLGIPANVLIENLVTEALKKKGLLQDE